MLLCRYPVILSIENHCTVPQQKKMAQYLMEVLQDKVDLSNINMNECRKLPSPEILKGKVLVKVEYEYHQNIEMLYSEHQNPINILRIKP